MALQFIYDVPSQLTCENIYLKVCALQISNPIDIILNQFSFPPINPDHFSAMTAVTICPKGITICPGGITLIKASYDTNHSFNRTQEGIQLYSGQGLMELLRQNIA